MNIKIGTVLTLEPISATEKLEKFHSKVVESTDYELSINYPVNTLTNRTAYLIDGSQFRVTFIDEEKNSFAFNTEVIGRKVNNIPMIVISLPSVDEIIKIKRREFVRVKASVDVAVEFENHLSQYVTQDISAGGLAFILNANVPFNIGNQIKLTIVLPFSSGEVRYVRTRALVVRIFELNNLKQASIQFLNTEDMDKQTLLRFCFERQLLNRKKELKTI